MTTLYHLTWKKNLPKIRQQGLVGSQSRDAWPEVVEGEAQKNAVWLFEKKDQVWTDIVHDYLSGDMRGLDKLVLIEVDVPEERLLEQTGFHKQYGYFQIEDVSPIELRGFYGLKKSNEFVRLNEAIVTTQRGESMLFTMENNKDLMQQLQRLKISGMVSVKAYIPFKALHDDPAKYGYATTEFFLNVKKQGSKEKVRKKRPKKRKPIV